MHQAVLRFSPTTSVINSLPVLGITMVTLASREETRQASLLQGIGSRRRTMSVSKQLSNGESGASAVHSDIATQHNTGSKCVKELGCYLRTCSKRNQRQAFDSCR
jgi:hypothetical protein